MKKSKFFNERLPIKNPKVLFMDLQNFLNGISEIFLNVKICDNNVLKEDETNLILCCIFLTKGSTVECR